jgi:hypothetical protein
MILVRHPLAGARPPVFEDESLGVLLTLASAESALSCRSSQPVFSMKVDLDPFSNARLDYLFRAPSSSVNVLSKSARKKRENV